MTEPDADPQPSRTLERAAIGDVVMDMDSRPILEGWHVCDGSALVSYEWPAFVAAMRIRGGTFVLPAPQRTLPGYRWIIKLGARRPLPTTPAR